MCSINSMSAAVSPATATIVLYDNSDSEDDDDDAYEPGSPEAFLKKAMNMSYFQYCLLCDSQQMDLPVKNWHPA